MTVSARKKDTTQEEQKPLHLASGIQYNCDFCHSDITHTVRIKCAAPGCEEVDLCPSCFCRGKEGGKHKRWHDYRVVEQHSYPIFTESWGADEELLLIEGLTLYGLGNWQDAAEHVGTRTREECEVHYLEVWVGNEPNDEGIAKRGNQTFDIDSETFQSRKKRRIEDMRSATAVIPNPQNSKPLVSAPTNHEIAGYMPGRLDFEHELHDEAENPVKDMEFGLVMQYGGGDQPGDRVAGEEGFDVVAGEETAGAAAVGEKKDSAVAEADTVVESEKMDVDRMEEDDEEDDQPLASTSTKPPPPPSADADPSFPSTSASSSRGLASSSTKTAAKSSSSKKQQQSSSSDPSLSASSTKRPPPPSSDRLLSAPLSPTSIRSSAQSSSALPISSSSNAQPSQTSPNPQSASSLPLPDPTAPSSTSTNASPPVPPPPPLPAVVVVAPLPVNTDSPDYVEDPDDLKLKLAVLDIYNDKLDRRREAKNLIFQRGLMDNKKIIAADRKRPQKEKDLIQKYKVFAKLQTPENHEVFIEGLLYEETLRARIAQLQTYRSKGITTIADAERYESQLEYRTTGIDPKGGRAAFGRASVGGPSDAKAGRDSREGSSGRGSVGPSIPPGRKPPAPLNLTSAASLHLLTPSEQELCSTLRILPKPYLMIKETLIREYARRNGNLRRREARGLIKIDVNKTSKIWSLLEETGVLVCKGGEQTAVAASSASTNGAALVKQENGSGGGKAGGLSPIPPPPPSSESLVPLPPPSSGGEKMEGVVEGELG